MSHNWKKLTTTVAVLCGSLVVAAGAQDAGHDELRKQVAALRAEVENLKAEAAASERIAELQRRIDLLAAEVEKARTGGAVEPPSLHAVKGLAPAASKVYGVTRGVSIGGYGEAVYENYAGRRQDDQPSGRTDQLDFVRQIVYLGYKFSDRILFNSEIEFEHASTGKGGEVSVEFAYVEAQPWRALGLRAGMLLLPMGFLNELHEPPIFHGARRPEVEQALVPSTWRENGAGLFGEVGPVRWRAYAVAGLSSAGLSASGIRGGRQSGARSKAEDFAFTGRADFTGVEGLLLGGSFFAGGSGQGVASGGQTIDGRVRILEGHGQLERRGLRLRALLARVRVGDVALINRANNLTGARSVGERQGGWYLEAGYDVMTLRRPGQWSVAPFVRYERLDTQGRVPAGFAEDPATDRRVFTFGVGVKPIPTVVFKADLQRHANEARTGVSQFNAAVGYLF